MRVSHLLGSSPFVLLLALSPGALHAQTIPSPYRFIETRQEFGLFAGHGTQGTGRFGYGPGSGLLFGGRYAVRLRGPLALEASTSFFKGNRDVMDPRRPEGDRKIGEAGFLVGTLDVGFRFSVVGDRTWHGLDPFIDFGIGYAFDLAGDRPTDKTLPDADRYSFGSSFHGILGGGTRFFISDRLALRADATVSFWKLHTPPGFADPELGYTNVPRGEWVGGTHLTLTALIAR